MRWSRDAFPPRGRLPFIWRGLISFWRGRRDRLLKEFPEAQACMEIPCGVCRAGMRGGDDATRVRGAHYSGRYGAGRETGGGRCRQERRPSASGFIPGKRCAFCGESEK